MSYRAGLSLGNVIGRGMGLANYVVGVVDVVGTLDGAPAKRMPIVALPGHALTRPPEGSLAIAEPAS